MTLAAGSPTGSSGSGRRVRRTRRWRQYGRCQFVSTLELASTETKASLNGFGTEFVNFAQILVNSGAAWGFTGTNSLAAGTTLTDQGTVLLTGTSVAGAGAVTIDSAAVTPASATIADDGSWSGANFAVGATGAGDLLIDTAGSVSASGIDVAQSNGSSGTITVTGSQSSLSNSGSFVVGDAGLGTSSIEAGGTVMTNPAW